jgi:hypothetical protein
MTTHAIGATEQVLDWLKALSLPSLQWAKELFPILGLPEGMSQHSELMASVHDQAQADYDALLLETARAANKEGRDRLITEAVVTKALQRIENQLGRDTAASFERWARCHLVSHATKNAITFWGMVLRHATPEPPPFASVPPPPALVPLLPEIARQVDGGRVDWLDAELRRLAPPVSQEERKLGLDMNSDALVLEQIALNELTIKALREIALHLAPGERAAVASWAHAQAEALNLPGKVLGGETYLRAEPPCADWPSALPPHPSGRH